MFRNPILRGLNPDPSICRAGEDYYLATSTLFLFPGVPIHHSRDLVNWRLIGHALTRREQFRPAPNGAPPMIYAPTLRFHNGTFYLITTNVHGGGNFYVTATDPAGPWSDPIFVDDEVFDPSLFFDDDGKVYYTRRGPLDEKDVLQAEIEVATGQLLSPLRSIGVGMVSDDAEGPHLYHIGEWYYLLQAEGGSRFLHMGTIGRARTPWGPFEPCPHNPIVAQHNAWWHPIKSLGHPDLVQAADGSWWAVFLGTRHFSYDALTLLGRETFLSPVGWKDGWPHLEPGALRSLEVDAPTLPLHSWPPLPVRDDFNEELGPRWTFLTLPDSQLLNTRERPGWLRLWGQEARLQEGARSTFAGVRQQEFRVEVATCLEFAPQDETEEAGISVFHRHDFGYDVFRSRRDGKPVVVLRKRVGDIAFEANVASVSDGALLLRVVAEPERYRFFYATVADHWIELGSGLTQLLTAEVVGSWNGVLLGIYATGNGRSCASPADFDWFDYRNTGHQPQGEFARTEFPEEH